MDWLWTWGGTCFGYRDGDNLWTYDGRHVARFVGKEVYARNGAYLGEVMSDNRLISCRAKSSWRKSSFIPFQNRTAYTRYTNYTGYAMYTGYEDFPAPESLR
ncbi:hypothetical protein [Burkholderia cepacia]|uniref:hypothetical protein n=1 Tax=Burkholderia cepacia TaxID=292 RepID=UPI00398F0146